MRERIRERTFITAIFFLISLRCLTDKQRNGESGLYTIGLERLERERERERDGESEREREREREITSKT